MRLLQLFGVTVGIACWVPVFAQAVPSPVATQGTTHGRARGAVPPPNLARLVQAQLTTARVASRLMGASVHHAPRPACSPTQPKFDWNALKKVSLVQDQGNCGSCWAFAAVAAYESSYLIENGLTASDSLPPPPSVDASDQEGLDCSLATDNCNGGWHDSVLDYFVNSGETTRPKYAAAPPPESKQYTGAKLQCKSVSPRQYFAVTWSFVSGQVIPSDSDLKAAICSHGPIVAAVNSQHWDDLLPNNDFVYSSANPNWSTKFPNGVFTEGAPSKVGLNMDNYNLTPSNLDIDHDVLIVGWDDTIGAWIVKNSWGTSFGEKGYIKLPYGHANIGFNAAWIQAKSIQSTIAPTLFSTLQDINLIKSPYMAK